MPIYDLGLYPSITHYLCSHFLPGFPKTLTQEGLDLTFATNYVGPFLLTNLLRGKEGWLPTFCAALTSHSPGIFVAYCFQWLLPFPWPQPFTE